MTKKVDENDTVFLKLFVYVIFINGFFCMNIMGWLALTGRVKTKSDETCKTIDKAKNGFLAATLAIPTWVVATIWIFKESDSGVARKVIWTIMMLYFGYSVVRYLNLKKHDHLNKNT